MKNSSIKRKIQKTNRFARDIKKLSSEVQEEAYKITVKLSFNIFDPDLRVKKLIGFDRIYRVVIMKEYRLIFSFDEENIYLLRIGHRKDIYKKIEI
ncbi:MAG TPA: hypothetical protein ENH29_00055 [Bacteroidetes bacterium]|nr:hypothetical protein [Bacteroidota bacterium]